jgi:hypothetical protein
MSTLHIHQYTFICAPIHIYMYTSTHLHVHQYTFTCTPVHIYMYTKTHLYVHQYTFICTPIHIYMYISTHLHVHQYTFTCTPVHIYGHISLDYTHNTNCFAQKLYRKSKQTFCIQQHFPENRAVCKIMWNYVVQPDWPQMTIRRMRCASCIPKATNTHSEYVIHIAFPRPQWLRERASILRHMYEYISCIVDAVQEVHTLYS